MMNTLDWQKVENFIKERQPDAVHAGLLEDWYHTAATIYTDGKWLDKDAAYVTSYWATPAFKAEMPNGDTLEVEASKECSDNEA